VVAIFGDPFWSVLVSLAWNSAFDIWAGFLGKRKPPGHKARGLIGERDVALAVK
jgi:hypothetical protein